MDCQTGGRRLASSLFHHVTDSHAQQRLPHAARGKVLELDLAAAGISDLGTLRQYGFGKSWIAPLEIFINGKALRLAEWPNLVSIFGLPLSAYRNFINILSVISQTLRQCCWLPVSKQADTQTMLLVTCQ